MGRRLARELALKILYRYEEGDQDLSGILNTMFQKKHYPDSDETFCKNLVKKTLNNIEIIDRHIIKVLENWQYERVSVIDKTILRLGTCELLYFNDIPARVSINEAIEIGKKFGGSDSGRFINGILDAVSKNREGSNNN
jgi:N utilization substance protein B